MSPLLQSSAGAASLPWAVFSHMLMFSYSKKMSLGSHYLSGTLYNVLTQSQIPFKALKPTLGPLLALGCHSLFPLLCIFMPRRHQNF